MSESDSERPQGAVVFDHANDDHRSALLIAGRSGLASRGGTEKVILDLRNKFGLIASVGTAFEGLILAADEDSGDGQLF